MKLFKYRNFNNIIDESRLSELLNGKFWFSKASDVNDPFEFRCLIDLVSNKQATIKIFAFIERRINPSITEIEALNKAKKVIESVSTEKLIQRQWETSYEMWKVLGNYFSMYCFAGCNDSLLMWSHYANAHQGICIEYEHSTLDELVREVKYDDNVTKISPEDFLRMTEAPLAMSEISQKLFLTKAECWRYEKEFRILFPSQIVGNVNLVNNSIKRIIIGCNFNPKKIENLKNIVQKADSRIRIAVALPLENTHKLIIEDIETL